MRSARPPRPRGHTPRDARQVLARNLRAVGCPPPAVVAAPARVLATWSATDPSLSNATGAAVRECVWPHRRRRRRIRVGFSAALVPRCSWWSAGLSPA